MSRFSHNTHYGRVLLASIATLLLLGLPAVAGASPGAVIQDCAQDGDLDGSYSNEDKHAAANSLPADLAEYSDCADVINGAITSANSSGAAGGGGNAAPSGGTTAPAETKPKSTKKKKRAKKKKAKRKRKEVLAAAPGGSGNDGLFKTAKASDGMPTPLLLALILGATLCAAGGFVLLHKRRPELGQAVLSRVPQRFRR